MKFAVLLALGATVRSNKLRKEDSEKPSTKGYRQVLRNEQDVQYFADFKIGGQEIAGIFDTGSFEVVVRSSRCTGCVHPTAPFHHELSSTFEENGTMVSHVYGSGSCKTMLGYDTVQVGPNMVAKSQPIWEITEHRIPVLDQAKFAAIVGIGPKFGYDSKMRTLLMNYNIDEFSICLKKDSGSNGYLTWGPDNDADLKEEEVVTAKVEGKHHWATSMKQVGFGFGKLSENKSDDVCADGCAAIIDSGTSLIAAPTHALAALSEKIGIINEDCSNLHELPDLHFTLDGKELVLPPQAYIMRVKGASLEADNIWDLLFFKPKLRKTDMCMPAFMQMDMQTKLGDVWILGMPFFRYYHTTFDRVNEAMHFAVAGPDCEPRPFKSNHSASLISFNAQDKQPLEVDIGALVPPTLSGMIDFPYNNKGEMDV